MSLGSVSSAVLLSALLAGPVRPDLVLVTVDTLRADSLGCLGAESSDTPHIDELSESSLLFEDVTAPAPLTVPSHAVVLTGEPLHELGIHANGDTLPPEVETLADRLRTAGYRTGAFVSGAPLARGTGLERGFQIYDDTLPDTIEGGRYPPERRGTKTVRAAVSWLEKARGPVFVWVHLFDPHRPYRKGPNGDRSAYAADVAAADAAVGALRAALNARGRPTALLLTADHGEALGDHGEPTHGVFLYQETIRVPLLLQAPGLKPGRVTEPVGLEDVTPTLLALAGITDPELPGRDLRGSGKPGRIFVSATRHAQDRYGWAALRTVRKSGWKYVEAPRPELYDLRHDPGERRNLFTEQPDLALRLRRHLPGVAVESTRAVVDAARREKLRSLGYAGGRAAPTTGMRPDPKDRARLLEPMDRASDHLFRGELEAAAVILTRVTADDPGNPVAWNDLGMARHGTGRYEDAARAFGKAIEATPEDPALWNNLGLARAAMGQGEAARAAYEEAARLGPRFGAPCLNRAILEEREGNTDIARHWVEEALRREPGLPKAQMLLARIGHENSRGTSVENQGGIP